MKQILLMIAMAPSPDQIGGIIFSLFIWFFMVLAFLCVGVCLLGGLVLLIFRFVDKVLGDDPVPLEEIPPPEEKASE